ncbi:MAG: hypothetical protein ACFCUI_12820 [Bernardetiaceae bacterium]
MQERGFVIPCRNRHKHLRVELIARKNRCVMLRDRGGKQILPLLPPKHARHTRNKQYSQGVAHVVFDRVRLLCVHGE